jgi:hypothetical protein
LVEPSAVAEDDAGGPVMASKIPKGASLMPTANESLRFETDIKPMFRERDRESMEFAFDLWSHDDVSQYADAILDRLRTGTMPCDGAWPPAQVDLFERWVETGKPR